MSWASGPLPKLREEPTGEERSRQGESKLQMQPNSSAYTVVCLLFYCHHHHVCTKLQLILSNHLCVCVYWLTDSLEMTVRGMTISLLKTLQQFGERRQTAACETTRKEGTKREIERASKKKKCKTAMFRVILSPGPDVVLALVFLSLCRENTLWSRQFERLWASAKTRLRLAFPTVCLVLRVSELGRFTIENPVKGFSRKYAWNVTRRGRKN